jgi:hypothetical protein
MNRDANLLPALDAILLPAETNSLHAKLPTVFPVIFLTILAIVSKIPPSPMTCTNVSRLVHYPFICSS